MLHDFLIWVAAILLVVVTPLVVIYLIFGV